MKKKLSIGIIIVIGLMGLIYYQYTTSFSYQYTQGRAAETKKEYSSAVLHYRRALEKKPEDVRTLYSLGNVYSRLGGQKELAKSFLLKAVSLDGNYTKAFSLLLKLYESDGDYDSMEKVLKYADGEEAKAVFNDFLIKPPVFSQPSGSYDDDIVLTLETPEDESDYQIFYTTDGKAPNGVHGHLYDGSLYLTEGKNVVKAVCRNTNGKFGEVEKRVYRIKYKTPAEPKADPNGGKFTKKKKVTLTADDGCFIYYSWSRKSRTPDASDHKYSEPIEIPKGYHVLSAVAIDRHGKRSKVYHMGFSYYPDK